MRDYLYNQLSVTLHPSKIYVQNYKHGVVFVGSIVKGSRMYIANRTVSNFIEAIYKYNHVAHKVYEYTKNYIKDFLSSINSYCGFLVHYNSYSIRRKMFKCIDSCWFSVCKIVGDFEHLKCLSKYDRIYQIKNKIKKFSYFNSW